MPRRQVIFHGGKRYEFWQEFLDRESAREEAKRIEAGFAIATKIVQVYSDLDKSKPAWGVYYISRYK